MTYIVASVLWPLVGITSFCLSVFGVVLICFFLDLYRNRGNKEEQAVCSTTGSSVEVLTLTYLPSTSLGFHETDEFLVRNNSRSNLPLHGTPLRCSALLPRARYSPGFGRLSEVTKTNEDNLPFPSKFGCENEPWAFTNLGFNDSDDRVHLQVPDEDVGSGRVRSSPLGKGAIAKKGVKILVGGNRSEKMPKLDNTKKVEKRLPVGGRPLEKANLKSAQASCSLVNPGGDGSNNSSSIMAALDDYESDLTDQLQDLTDDDSVIKFKSEIKLAFKDVEDETPEKPVHSGWFKEENDAPCNTFKSTVLSGKRILSAKGPS
ncbi:uncharacterized protein [Procambarus clarkii]|nr:uncharacterized protein LOC123762674 isoform X2 [Procambarus clarkii]